MRKYNPVTFQTAGDLAQKALSEVWGVVSFTAAACSDIFPPRGRFKWQSLGSFSDVAFLPGDVFVHAPLGVCPPLVLNVYI